MEAVSESYLEERRSRLSQPTSSLRFSEQNTTATRYAGVERPPSSLPKPHRLRRRGPRSYEARAKRHQNRNEDVPTVSASGEVLAVSPNDEHVDEFIILSINIRGFIARSAVLSAYLEASRADIVCLQETWLDSSVEEVKLPGFRLISRKDRLLGQKAGYGGVAVFARDEVADAVCFLEHSDVAERTWVALQSSVGPLLLCNWYRAPDADQLHTESFRDEIERLGEDFVGIHCCGDLNIHHRKWLRFSRADTSLGDKLKCICDEFALHQYVREPTRGPYLLDLVLSDLVAHLEVDLLPEIADHKVTRNRIHICVRRSSETSRNIWHYSKANWTGLKTSFRETDWNTVLQGDLDEAVERFTNVILEKAREFIPHGVLKHRKSTHPWVTERCREALRHQQSLEDTVEYNQAREASNTIFKEEYLAYVARLRLKISQLPKGSKAWWKLNRELLNRQSKVASIPPLRNLDGEWVTDPREKAELLAETFQRQCKLPDGDDTFEESEDANGEQIMSDFCTLRRRWAKRILREVNPSKATGPDDLPGRILKECAAELAEPVVRVARRIFHESKWPETWRTHWIHPLFKKGSPSSPLKYRGVHLTPILSKCVERILAIVLVQFFEAAGLYGDSQWAFRKGVGCRDLVGMLTCKWLLGLCEQKKIGIFLSDISGAFDKVFSPFLLSKCRKAGVSDRWCKFLASYLAPRNASVLVGGAASKLYAMANQVFQGTVLGPPLWNVFFADIRFEIIENGASEVKFADDLTAFKEYSKTDSTESILEDLGSCQAAAHSWGDRNRVSFDAIKSFFVVLHGRETYGEPFKLLGVKFDTRLLMVEEINRILGMARSKV